MYKRKTVSFKYCKWIYKTDSNLLAKKELVCIIIQQFVINDISETEYIFRNSTISKVAKLSNIK